jgi:hypothetical protein
VNDRPTLTPRHQWTLTIESAIDPDTANERGYCSVTATDPRLATFADYQKADGILIPIRPPDGTNGRYQLRRDRDRVRSDGSTAKYEQAAGEPHRLDVHPRFHDKLADPSVHAWIGEGVKKGDALASRGELCISLGGVDCGLTPACLEDWKHIAIKGRTFLICFDYDPKPTTQQNVGRARDRLAAFLTERGARVRIIRLPQRADGSKAGIDDYLAEGGELVALLAKHCTDWTPPAAAGDCPRDDCRVTREQFRLQTRILTETGLRPNRRLPYYALVNRVQSDLTRAKHPEAEKGKPETWKRAEPLTDPDGFVGVNLQKMAKDTGIGYGTLVKARAELIELGVLEAREQTEIIPNPKDPGRKIEIARTLVRPVAASPREMVQKLVTVVQAPSGWGGKRVWRCPDHAEAKIKTKRVCMACGKDAVQVELPPEPTDFQVENRSPDASPSPPSSSSANLENRTAVERAEPPTATDFQVENRPPDTAAQDARWAEARADVDAVLSDFKLETGEQPPDEVSPEDRERAKRRACGEAAYQDGKLLGWMALMDTDGTTCLVRQGEWFWEALRTGAHPNIEHIAARARRKAQQMEQEYRF